MRPVCTADLAMWLIPQLRKPTHEWLDHNVESLVHVAKWHIHFLSDACIAPQTRKMVAHVMSLLTTLPSQTNTQRSVKFTVRAEGVLQSDDVMQFTFAAAAARPGIYAWAPSTYVRLHYTSTRRSTQYYTHWK